MIERVANIRQLFRNLPQAVFHISQRRVDLMRNARHHLPQRRHFFRLYELRLGFLEVFQCIHQLTGSLLDPVLQSLVGCFQPGSKIDQQHQQGRCVINQVDTVAFFLLKNIFQFAVERQRQIDQARPRTQPFQLRKMIQFDRDLLQQGLHRLFKPGSLFRCNWHSPQLCSCRLQTCPLRFLSMQEILRCSIIQLAQCLHKSRRALLSSELQT